MSTVSVGREAEKRCEDFFSARGYVTWRVRRARFGNMDMFGLFDVVALDERKGGTPWMRFVQVKVNRWPSKAQVQAIEALRLPPGCVKEIWVWSTGKKAWVRQETV